MKLLLALFIAAAAMAQQSQQAASATLDKMAASGKSQREIAQYVFDTHGCKGCHTASQDGKTSFTDKGKQLANGFEGCVSLLASMNLIAQVSAAQRSPEQRQKAAKFEEYGCTFCHRITPGKLGFTEVGAKLSHMHLGCVDIERQVSSKPAGK